MTRDSSSPPASTEHASHRSLAAAVRAVSGVTLLSRLGGLARDVLLVHIFGATAVGSAFASAFAIPNMFRRLFGEGALSAAFIPEYTRARKADPALAGQLASLTLVALGAATSAITILIELVLLLVLVLAPPNPDRELSLRLIMLMLPFMPLICGAATLSGILQVHGRYGPAASGPLLLNGFIIAAGLYYIASGRQGGPNAAYTLGAVTVASGLTQSLAFFIILRGQVRWTRAWSAATAPARAMFRRFIPVMLGLGTLQLNAFFDQLIAMWPLWVGPTILGFAYPLDKASAGIIAFTQRLYQFPLGVFGIAVATAIFPLLSRHHDEPAAFLSTLRRGVRLSLFIGLPASIGLMLVRTDATRVLFSFGDSGFDERGLTRSAAVLLGYAPAVWAYSLNHVLTRAFYARADTRTPTRIAIYMVGLNVALNVILIWPLHEAGPPWATSISATLQCLILMHLCRTRLDAPVLDAQTRGACARIALASAFMACPVLAFGFLWERPADWSAAALRLLAASVLGAIAYLVAARLLRLPELGWLLSRRRTARTSTETPARSE
ncbi:MAG: murein biosynthesis integral membrane protein MurJ [Phycisphaerales bacterium]|nr:murein biosynthesis integral membrane protein MurJ [Phycisphaerales bacterium]